MRNMVADHFGYIHAILYSFLYLFHNVSSGCYGLCSILVGQFGRAVVGIWRAFELSCNLPSSTDVYYISEATNKMNVEVC